MIAAWSLQATDCRVAGHSFGAQMLEGKIHSRRVRKCGLYSTLHSRTLFSAVPTVAAVLKSLLFPPETYSPKEKSQQQQSM